MKLINELKYKIFGYINTSKMKNGEIEFENYSQLFQNNKVT